VVQNPSRMTPLIDHTREVRLQAWGEMEENGFGDDLPDEATPTNPLASRDIVLLRTRGANHLVVFRTSSKHTELFL
jgi:hypothetical protein